MFKLRTVSDNSLSTPLPATTISRSHDVVVEREGENAVVQGQESVSLQRTSNVRQQKRLFGIHWTRSRKRAAVTLVVAGMIGWRWCVANTPVDIPLPKSHKPQLTQPNAFHFYAAAADAYDYSKLASFPYAKSDYTSKELPLKEKKRALTEAAESLRLLRQGFAYRYLPGESNWYSTTEVDHSIGAPVPNFVTIRTMARMLAAESQIAAAEGRHAEAMNSALDAVRFGQDVGHGNSLIEGMIGVLCQGIGLDEAVKNVDGLTASEARVAANRLSSLIADEQTFPEVMEQERLMIYATAAKMMTMPMSMASTFGDSSNAIQTAGSLAAYQGFVFYYTKDGIFQSYKQCMDEIGRQTSLPYQQSKNLAMPEPTIPFLKTIIPDYRKAVQSYTMKLAAKRVLLARLAVHAYRLEHGGKLPASLSDLMQGPNPYLTALPNDPLSSDGKDTLRYKDGVVYSVGENGIDDGYTGDDRVIGENH